MSMQFSNFADGANTSGFPNLRKQASLQKIFVVTP